MGDMRERGNEVIEGKKKQDKKCEKWREPPVF